MVGGPPLHTALAQQSNCGQSYIVLFFFLRNFFSKKRKKIHKFFMGGKVLGILKNKNFQKKHFFSKKKKENVFFFFKYCVTRFKFCWKKSRFEILGERLSPPPWENILTASIFHQKLKTFVFSKTLKVSKKTYNGRFLIKCF